MFYVTYIIFKGKLTTTETVTNAVLACRSSAVGQYFFYAPSIKFPAGTTVAYAAHAQNVADAYWTTTFSTESLSETLQGISSSSAATEVSYSKRKNTVPPYEQSIRFFEFNEKYSFDTGSTVEVWGIPAE